MSAQTVNENEPALDLVWVVYDQHEDGFADWYETQREAQDRCDELNNAYYLTTVSTFYERYSVDSLPTVEAAREFDWKPAS